MSSPRPNVTRASRNLPLLPPDDGFELGGADADAAEAASSTGGDGIGSSDSSGGGSGGGSGEPAPWDNFKSPKLPPHPTIVERLTLPFRIQIVYLQRLASAFTWKYVSAVVSVYGINQGIGEAFFYFAFDFYVADDLKLTPSRASELGGLAHGPWELKAVFGMLSDAFPIFGYKRAPYIVIFGTLGTVACLWVGLADLTVAEIGLVGVLLWFVNLANAGPDVMIDATNAERVVTHPALASDIQSLTWGSLGVFGVIAGLTEGPLQAAFGARGVFLATSLTAAVIVLPAAGGWLFEKREENNFRSGCGTFAQIMRSPQQRPVFEASTIVACFSLFLGLFGVFFDVGENTRAIKSAVTLICAPLIALLVYLTLKKTDKTIAKISAFIFLRPAMNPSTRVMFYWYHASADNQCDGYLPETNATLGADEIPLRTALTFVKGGDVHMHREEEYGRPCLSPEFLGLMAVASGLFSYFGTALCACRHIIPAVLATLCSKAAPVNSLCTLLANLNATRSLVWNRYNRYFTGWSYRTIWTTMQIGMVFFNLLDLLWVTRLNLLV